jgi:hypothetical protein
MASNSKGRIGDKVTISTLEYNLGRFAHIYKRYYKEEVPKDTLDEVFNVSTGLIWYYLDVDTSKSIYATN